MRQDEVVRPGERRERFHGLLDVRLLNVGIGLFAPLQQGVAAQCRNDSQGRLLSPARLPARRRYQGPVAGIVAIMSALMVCIRFSAWSNTTEAGDSKTSSVTSSASSPRLS
jgi:hypothetical protein